MDISTKSGQYLINHYGTPGQIIECGVEALAEILKKVSRGKLGYQRARALHQAACKSAGVREGAVSMVFEIKECLRLIEACDRFIRELEEKMANYLKEIPYSGSLRSIKGIGPITAAGLIGEVGDFRKFRTISEILKHGGLDLFEISSGKHRGQRRISKRGRPLMRKLLFYAAINVVRKGGVMHERYQRYLQRGMPKIKALVAIMRKLLAIMFALVRDHSQYVAGYTKPQPLLTEAA